MKYLFFLLFLACFCQSLFAQNWQPLIRNDIYNFKHKDSPFIPQSIWVKYFTATNQGDSTFYLNLIGNHFIDSTYSNGTGSSLCSEGVAYNLPHFLQKEAVKLADSTWIFQSPNISYYLKPFAQLNDTWLFEANNSITATVVSIDTLQIIGQSDSVKKILLSIGDSIFLSKNYGILRFPTFDNTLYVEWAGIQTRSLGDTIFHYREIYDFEVGDVFYYDIYWGYGPGSGIPGSFYTNIYKKVKSTVTHKSIGSNYVQYYFHWDIQTKTEYMGPYTFSSQDYSAISFYKGNAYAYNAYPHQYVNDYGGYALMDWDNTFNCHTKSFPYGYIQGPASSGLDTAWGGDCFEWTVRSGMKYGKGIGLIHSGQFGFGFGVDLSGSQNDRTLVGYIKNGISVGTIYPDWQYTGVESPQTPLFSLSPNPAKEQMSITLSKENNFNIRIWDIQGREKLAIYSPNISTTININNWAKGIYFVQILDEKGRNIHTEKFIKE